MFKVESAEQGEGIPPLPRTWTCSRWPPDRRCHFPAAAPAVQTQGLRPRTSELASPGSPHQLRERNRFSERPVCLLQTKKWDPSRLTFSRCGCSLPSRCSYPAAAPLRGVNGSPLRRARDLEQDVLGQQRRHLSGHTSC